MGDTITAVLNVLPNTNSLSRLRLLKIIVTLRGRENFIMEIFFNIENSCNCFEYSSFCDTTIWEWIISPVQVRRFDNIFIGSDVSIVSEGKS